MPNKASKHNAKLLVDVVARMPNIKLGNDQCGLHGITRSWGTILVKKFKRNGMNVHCKLLPCLESKQQSPGSQMTNIASNASQI